MKEIVEEKIKVFVRIKPVRKNISIKKKKDSPSKDIIKIEDNINLLSKQKSFSNKEKNEKTNKLNIISNLISDESFCKNEKTILSDKVFLKENNKSKENSKKIENKKNTVEESKKIETKENSLKEKIIFSKENSENKNISKENSLKEKIIFSKENSQLKIISKPSSIKPSLKKNQKIQITPMNPQKFTTPKKSSPPMEISQVKSLLKNGTNQIMLDLYTSLKKETFPILKKERKKLIDEISKEINKDISFIKIKDNCIAQNDNGNVFEYDEVFDDKMKNLEIFKKIMEPNFDFIYKGNNFSVFMYGQTCSGKTYTMKGNFVEDLERNFNLPKVLDISAIKRTAIRSKERVNFSSSSQKNIGLIQMTLKKIFSDLEQKENINFQIKFSYYEIYNEKIYDLLGQNETPLEIREDKSKKMNILGLKKPIIKNYKEAMSFFTLGEKRRHFAATEWNHNSSRSHVVFTLEIEIRLKQKFVKSFSSIITLADLAGSESIGSKKKNKLIKEGAHINKSLLALSNVIKKLNKNNKYVSFRDSKLTRILKPVLSGNSRTSIICTINPLTKFMSETINTLRFGISAGGIKMKVQQNIKDLQNFTESNIKKKKELFGEIEEFKKELFSLKEKNIELTMENDFFKENINNLEQENEANKILIENFNMEKKENILFKDKIEKIKEMQISNTNNFDVNKNNLFQNDNFNTNKENYIDYDYLKKRNLELEKKLKNCEYKLNLQNLNPKKNDGENNNNKKENILGKKIRKRIKMSIPKEDYIKWNKDLTKKLKRSKRNENKLLENERKLKELLSNKNENIKKLKKIFQNNYVMNL